MINLIAEYNDNSINVIIDYLYYLSNGSVSFDRLNSDDTITDIHIELNSDNKMVQLCKSEKLFEFSKFNVNFYRRGSINYSNLNALRGSLNPKFYKILHEEHNQIINYIGYVTKNIGSFNEEYENNKFINLNCASEAGILIPATIITNKKSALLDFYNRFQKIITKPIHHGHIKFSDIESSSRYSSPGTILLGKDAIDSVDDYFLPSLFQEYIEKKYEIRIFFFQNEFFPMAIFSQYDEKTKIDFRNYNELSPNKNVPFKLPDELQNKLLSFVKKVNLTTGSIDLVCDTNEDFYFLEVNPGGQFGWVSKNCNYYIEKKIALTLLNQSYEAK